ncbi:MAG: methylmalonyl-CoA mutase [Calditrichaeota bacterium]|nr:MAG: methylmalonyl-CoA mutase [Calditrichota bacterium]
MEPNKNKFPKSINLLDDFDLPSYEEWRQAVEKLLKGAPYDKIMPTKTYEGITLEPMYRKEDMAGIDYLQAKPGEAPYVRGTRPLGYLQKNREIAQEIRYPAAQEFNRALLADLRAGQTAVNLIVDKATKAGQDSDESSDAGQNGVAISTLEDLEIALKNVDLQNIPLHISCGVSSLGLSAMLAALCKKNGLDMQQVQGSVSADPLAELAETGKLPISFSAAMNDLANATKWALSNAQNIATCGVDVAAYLNAGASAVQELAFAMATGVQYLREMTTRGLAVDDVAPKMCFTFALGSNFFMEVSKLRAARLLWSQVVAAFGGGEEAQKIVIHAKTGSLNKTIYDPYVNMLRTTTEAFSGVLGGVDSMHVGPFDEVIRPADDFSRRIARNTQIILDKESHFDRVVDPAGGSWYIENLTNELAGKAWELFQKIEADGGMFAALEKNVPQSETAATAAARWNNLAMRKDKSVGTNVYANMTEEKLQKRPIDLKKFSAGRSKYLSDWRKKSVSVAGGSSEKMAELIEAVLSGATIGSLSRARHEKSSGISILPLEIHRTAEPFEKLRLAMEKYKTKSGAALKVFLANMGPVAQHKARADFSAGFFQIAGFEVISPAGFSSTEEAVAAAVESQAAIVVLCSTDKSYPELVPDFVGKLKETRSDVTVLLAGYPNEFIEKFKESGIDDFVHIRANAYEILSGLMKKLGGTK